MLHLLDDIMNNIEGETVTYGLLQMSDSLFVYYLSTKGYMELQELILNKLHGSSY